MKSGESLYPCEIDFGDENTKRFCDKVMAVDVHIHRRKQYFWFLAERNLLAALILYIGTLDVDLIQKQLERGLGVFKNLPEDHPAVKYYNLIKDHPRPVRENIINGLLVRLTSLH